MECIREDTDHPKIITMLLDHDVDRSVRGENGETLLHLSVISKPRAKALLQYTEEHPDVSFDVNARDNNGKTPLHYAAVACNADVMELLIEYRAEVAAADKDGVTTMHFAVYSPRCIQVTVDRGGDPRTAHARLGTPLEFARRIADSNHHSVKLLESLTPETGENEDSQAQTAQGPRDDPSGDAEMFQELTTWMLAHKKKHSILCRKNIARHLRASQEEGVVEEE